MNLKKQWRILALVVLVGVSVGTLAGVNPMVSLDASDNTTSEVQESSVTTLRYGLELAGGTRIRAPLIGLTAEEADVSTTNTLELEQQIAENLDGVSPTDVAIYTRVSDPESTPSVELTADNVSISEFESALDASGVGYEAVRAGVTPETREETIRVLNDKVNQAGLSGGSAREVQASNGAYFILIEVPDQSRQEVRDLIDERGVVRIDFYYPTADGYQTREAVLEQNDFYRVGSGTTNNQAGPHVPVVLTADAAARFETATTETGIAPSGSSCVYDAAPEQTDACILTLVDGEVVYSAGMSPSLASDIASGAWKTSPNFILQTGDRTEANQLSLHLRAGSLPAALDLDEGTSTYVSATQGDRFKQSSLLIGILATLAVGLKVMYRYRDLRVAVPMVFTALSEVVILLGIAAFLQYPIDLAVVGGLIAVIGTGVDDLIIITNEILAKGDINSSRVFNTRFKKAFWVIGAAAITTIVALLPLMVLSLGDLRGFAIFTIIGVVIGVGITRPAYGDVLKRLLLD